MVTAAICISECTSEVNTTRNTVLENVKADEDTALKLLTQMISIEEAKDVSSYLPSLRNVDKNVEMAAAMFTLPQDNDFGECSDNDAEHQLSLLTGPARIHIQKIDCQMNDLKSNNGYTIEMSIGSIAFVLDPWRELDYFFDVTSDQICYKKFHVVLCNTSDQGCEPLGRASMYLHDLIVTPTSIKQSMTMSRSEEALDTYVTINIPLLDSLGDEIGFVAITAKLEICYFSKDNGIFDSVTIAKLNRARRERYSACINEELFLTQVKRFVALML